LISCGSGDGSSPAPYDPRRPDRQSEPEDSTVDPIDLEIVRALQRDGRLSQEQLAQRVRLSRPAVHQRVKRLEAAGVIRGYQALVDWRALGKPMTSFIWVRTAGADCVDTGAAILRAGDDRAVVEECHRVTGEWCMLLKVRVADPLALQDLIDRVRGLPNVQATMTTLALSSLTEPEQREDPR